MAITMMISVVMMTAIKQEVSKCHAIEENDDR
jgi:hypothetical protein